jgi:hypothetical protein
MPATTARTTKKPSPHGSVKKSDVEVLVLARQVRDARGAGTFASFCADHGLHTRKAYDLITIIDAVDARRLSADDVRHLGWSKARLVASHGESKALAAAAVSFALNNTLPALARYLRHPGKETRLVTKCFHLTINQARKLEHALMAAGGQMSGGRMKNRSEALMAVVDGRYLQTNSLPPNRKRKPVVDPKLRRAD